MQNAIIKYKIRLDKPPVEGKEIEINLQLDDMEGQDVISDIIMERGYYDSMGHSSDYWTVIERTIEPFNED